MNELCNLKCEACRAGAAPLTDEETADMIKQVPEWEITESDGIKKVERMFKFKNFAQALEFTDRTGALAEENGHHPRIVTEWGKVTVIYWTHKIGGLHSSDLIMAAKTDKLYGGE